MMNKISINRTLLNGVAILALCYLGFIMSVIWNGADKVYWLTILVTWLLGGITPASAMAEPPPHYFFYGHFTLVFYALIFGHLKTLRTRLNSNVFHLSLLLLSLAIVGDVLAYWLSEFYGVGLRAIGFWNIELPALVSLILFWFSLGLYRWVKQKNMNGLVWTLPMALLSVAVIQYMPHSLLLVILVVLNLGALVAPNKPKITSKNSAGRASHEVSG